MRTRKEIRRDGKEHHDKMAERPPDKHAADWFHRPAGVTIMIQAQATQIEHKTVEEYLSEKYGIGSGADGQRKKTDR